MTQRTRRVAIGALVLTCTIGASSASMAQEARREDTRADEMADLTARSLTAAPEYPAPGERVELRLQVRNRGAATVPKLDVAFFANGAPVGTRTVTVGAQSTATITIAWIAKAEGAQTISASVDPRRPSSNAIARTTRSRSTSSSPRGLRPPPTSLSCQSTP